MYCPYSEEGRDRSSEGAGVGPLARLTSKCNIIDEYSHGLDEMDWYSHCLTDSYEILCVIVRQIYHFVMAVCTIYLSFQLPLNVFMWCKEYKMPKSQAETSRVSLFLSVKILCTSASRARKAW